MVDRHAVEALKALVVIDLSLLVDGALAAAHAAELAWRPAFLAARDPVELPRLAAERQRRAERAQIAAERFVDEQIDADEANGIGDERPVPHEDQREGGLEGFDLGDGFGGGGGMQRGAERGGQHQVFGAPQPAVGDFGNAPLRDAQYARDFTDEVVKTIPVGERPRALVFSKDFKKLFICASDSNVVQELEVATDKIVTTLPSGADPEQFDISRDNTKLFIANENDAAVTVVDTASRTVVKQFDTGVEPDGIAISPDQKWAIATSETTSMVHWFDVEKMVAVDDTLVDQRPRYARFSLDSKLLWVRSEVGGSVTLLDVATRKILKVIQFDIPGVLHDEVQPVGIRLTTDGKYAFIALGPSNQVAVVDAHTYEVLKYILVGRRVWHMALTPEEDKLYTTNGVSGDVTVIDVKTLEPVKSIKVGRYPRGAAILPTGK